MNLSLSIPFRLCPWRAKLVCAVAGLTLAAALPGLGQVIGYVPVKDATVTGATDLLEGQAVLAGSVAVTAKDHTAVIRLGRGGGVRVCQTSVLHLTESRAAAGAAQLAAPLLLSLDRGAIEVQMHATPSDALMTPDLRFAVQSGGPLDLRMRLAQNGDTCVENRGAAAPIVTVSDPFGASSYQLKPGQHVLFEQGSVREVVDHEADPCGCPDSPGMSVAEALLAPGAGGKPATPASEQANAQHPFPAAQSEGLAPTPGVPQAPPGVVHAQVTQNLRYDGSAPESAPAANGAGDSRQLPPAVPARRGFFGSIGHFFHRVFTGS
jgi:hypothetical protein